MSVVHMHWQTCTLIIKGYCARVSERNVTFLNATVSQHFCLTVAGRPVAPQYVIRKNRDMSVKSHNLNKFYCSAHACTCAHMRVSTASFHFPTNLPQYFESSILKSESAFT